MVYLDESGGDFSSDPRIRRAGWGLAFLPKRRGDGIPELKAACQLIAGFSGTVAGTVQTTPRAALTAFIFALRATCGPLLIKPDAAYLVMGTRSGAIWSLKGQMPTFGNRSGLHWKPMMGLFWWKRSLPICPARP